MTDKLDVSKLRIGDVVTVRAKVRSLPIVDGCNIEILMEPGGPVYVDPASIVSVEPRPLKVGDRVRSPMGVEHEIQAIAYGNALTVSVGGGEPNGFRLSQLSPA